MAGLVALALAGTALGGFYTVQPTEMAGVRRLGTVVTAEPVVVSYEASHRWNGQLPATMLGGGTAPTAMFTLPASVGQQAAQR